MEGKQEEKKGFLGKLKDAEEHDRLMKENNQENTNNTK